MKQSSTTGSSCAGIFVTGREITAVNRHSYGDARIRESDRTNVKRRTMWKTHSRGEQATVYGQASPYARLHTISTAYRQPSNEIKIAMGTHTHANQ
jgi:hypothetical protein